MVYRWVAYWSSEKSPSSKSQCQVSIGKPLSPKKNVVSPKQVGSGVQVKKISGSDGTITGSTTESVQIKPFESAAMVRVTLYTSPPGVVLLGYWWVGFLLFWLDLEQLQDSFRRRLPSSPQACWEFRSSVVVVG